MQTNLKINWELGDLIDTDPEEIEKRFIAYGKDVFERLYETTATFSCNELISIDNIILLS